MNKLFYRFLFLLVLTPVVTFSQEIAALQKEAEKLEVTSQEQAFKKYQEILNIQPVNVNALCKCSELCSSIGHRQTNNASKLDYFKAARHFAELALRVSPTNSEANFVMAIATGRLAMVLGGRKKIEAVNEIKKYAELSIKYDPNNFKPYHVLGKWHYEVSTLSGFERTAAKIFYGGLPPASMKMAIYYYDKSRALNPEFALNYLELAKAYNQDGQRNKAVENLNRLMTIPNKTQDDPRIKEEGRKLMAQLK